MKIRHIVFSAITFFTLNESVLAAGFTGPRQVEAILTNTNGSLFIQLNGAAINPAACSISSSYFLNANGAAGAKGMYAMVLSAQVSGQRVTLGIDGNNCSGGNGSGYPIVISAKIVP